jgi:hypothetical protein
MWVWESSLSNFSSSQTKIDPALGFLIIYQPESYKSFTVLATVLWRFLINPRKQRIADTNIAQDNSPPFKISIFFVPFLIKKLWNIFVLTPFFIIVMYVSKIAVFVGKLFILKT